MKLAVDFRNLPSKIIRASILLVLSTDSKMPQQSLLDYIATSMLGTISVKDPMTLGPRVYGPGPVDNATSRCAEPLQLRRNRNAAIRCRSRWKKHPERSLLPPFAARCA